MSKTFGAYDPDRDFLMPASVRDWLAGEHLAYFISDVKDQLDLSEILARYESEERGVSAVSPGDDGKGTPLRLLYWGIVVAEDREASL